MANNPIDPKIQEIIDVSHEVKKNAYCPYSNFRVGAAVLCEDGSVYPGCNVENVSYGLCQCAERVAIMNAVSGGHTSFKAMAMCSDIKDDFKAPCGACRQFLAEFGLDLEIYSVKPDKTWKMFKLDDIYPMAFTPKSLTLDRV